MKKEEIHFADMNRWLFGQAPPEFMIEVVIRTVLIFLLLLFVIRILGKRMSGQITLTELAVMITLGAIVAPVMQIPDRGLLWGVAALVIAIIFQRGYSWVGFKSKKVEEITQGAMSLLVKDGTVVLAELAKTHISRQQLFAMLREKKIQNLAKVERAYLEACGVLSVYESDQVKPGLPLYPSSDLSIKSSQLRLDGAVMACCSCGHVQRSDGNATCEICQSTEWSEAFLATK